MHSTETAYDRARREVEQTTRRTLRAYGGDCEETIYTMEAALFEALYDLREKVEKNSIKKRKEEKL